MRSLAGTRVVRAFEKAGFEVVRQNGSHRIMKRAGDTSTISVPVHAGKDVKRGTLRGLISAAGMTPDEFWKFVDS
jgi:predicted RNA binding protein YcfA (HicA-like mRNA interferase family)